MELELYTNGKDAFERILRECDSARQRIDITMFVWRDDTIGNLVAEHLCRAADRGVKIHIRKDRYASLLEHSEENGRSFFHKSFTLQERICVDVLTACYKNVRTRSGDSVSTLYRRLMEHPNIQVETAWRYDHSKYYIFDDDTIIMGGMNIEDKELDRDIFGKKYQDLMIGLHSSAAVRELRNKLYAAEPAAMSRRENAPDYFFTANIRTPFREFEIEQTFLRIIREAKQELTVIMAYFSPVKAIMNEIYAACLRGVRVTVILSENANLMDGLNKCTCAQLMKHTKGALSIRLIPQMIHTKLIFSENEICLGSCNITRKSLYQIGELNFGIKNSGDFSEKIMKVREEYLQLSEPVLNEKKLSYPRLKTFFERMIM